MKNSLFWVLVLDVVFQYGVGGGGLFGVWIQSAYWKCVLDKQRLLQTMKTRATPKKKQKNEGLKIVKNEDVGFGVGLGSSNFKQRRPDNPTDPNKTLKNNKPKHHKNGTSNKQIKEDSLLVACGGCRKMCC